MKTTERAEALSALYHGFGDGALPQTVAAEPVAADLTRAERKELDALRAAEAARQAWLSCRIAPREFAAEAHAAGSPGKPMTIWSDWHWGETVRADETAGQNEFSPEIAHARVERLVNGTLRLLDNYGGANPTYDGIVVCLGGDLISGGIHDELSETNWAPPVGQAFQVHDEIAGALVRMADRFGSVFVPCVVGNHGRNAKKPRAKLRILENSEYWLYRALEQFFANDKRIEFQVSVQTDIDFAVYGHRFKLTHGDTLGVRGGDGQIGALGPIVRGVLKTNASDREIARDCDTMIMGHWHSYQPRGALIRGIVNGTLKGYDEYSRTMLRAPFNKPSQALWLVSPKHGIAAQWEVEC